MNIPDKIGTEIGWRGWHAGTQGGQVFLHSIVDKALWRPGHPMEALCAKEHESPAARCTCGIYAARTLDYLREIAYHTHGILGEVHLWGTIVPGRLGWRAQYAYPKRLYVPHDKYQLVAPLRKRYQVPVHLINPYTGEAK